MAPSQFCCSFFRLENADENVVKNMKRESKAYSFKEQQEEIQLRKELEEKKKKAGKVKAFEFSDKQKEIIRLELEKETKIREKLKQVSGVRVFQT